MTVDTKSYELAEHFLPSGTDGKFIFALAAQIQTAIEDWLLDYPELSNPHK